jgi:hypothetical protein
MSLNTKLLKLLDGIRTTYTHMICLFLNLLKCIPVWRNHDFFCGHKIMWTSLVIFLFPLSNQPICRRSAHIALNLFLLTPTTILQRAWWSICICWIVGFTQIVGIIVLKTPTTILQSLDIEERPMINLHMLTNTSILSNHMQKPPVPTNNIQ